MPESFTSVPTMQAAILSIGTATSEHRYDQEQVLALAGYKPKSVVSSIFRNAGIQTRSLVLSPEHRSQEDPEWFQRHYAEWAPRLAATAARRALEQAGLIPEQIDYLVVTSCTGYLCPGLSQLLAQSLGLSSRAKTANLVGMGCNAMVPALERATEFAERHLGSVVLTVAVEICSATYWLDEHDLESAVGNAIFSDGASAAVVGVPKSGTHPFLVGFASRANRELIDYMGFYNERGRLRVRLSREVPEAVLPLMATVIEDLLRPKHLAKGDIANWIVHPGGKRVLDLAEERFSFLTGKLEPSRAILRDLGNMSSATILFVLERTIKDKPARVGDLGLMLAMGPGLSVEGALLEWRTV